MNTPEDWNFSEAKGAADDAADMRTDGLSAGFSTAFEQCGAEPATASVMLDQGAEAEPDDNRPTAFASCIKGLSPAATGDPASLPRAVKFELIAMRLAALCDQHRRDVLALLDGAFQ